MSGWPAAVVMVIELRPMTMIIHLSLMTVNGRRGIVVSWRCGELFNSNLNIDNLLIMSTVYTSESAGMRLFNYYYLLIHQTRDQNTTMASGEWDKSHRRRQH